MVRALGDGWLYASATSTTTPCSRTRANIRLASLAPRSRPAPLDSPWTPPSGRPRGHRRLPRGAQVFFCDPPGGAVGLTADQAERAGHRARVIDVEPGQTVPGASLYADGYTGRARMVVDADHGYLLGVTFVGPGVEELTQSATIAVAGQVPLSRLWHAVPASPSSARSGSACSRHTAGDSQANPSPSDQRPQRPPCPALVQRG